MSDDLTRLTDEEREAIRYVLGWDGSFAVVESILAARTTALIDRAERAERERDEARQAHAELMQVAGEKYEALRDRAKTAAAGLGGKNDRLAAELAALRAAVTGLADQWEAEWVRDPDRVNLGWAANQVRALLTDEGDNQ